MNISKTVLFSLIVVLGFHSCQFDDFKRSGETVIVRLESDADRLNTILTQSQYGRMPSELAHMSLMVLNDSLEYEPYLVKSKPIEKQLPDNGISFTFEIRDEAVWDDGKPVTAYDYLFTIKTILNPNVESGTAAFVDEMVSIDIDSKNPKQFTISMRPRSIYSLDYITNSFNVIPEHILDPQGLMKKVSLTDLLDPNKAEALSKDPNVTKFAELFNSPAYSTDPKYLVGCGAYRIESWEAGKQIVVKKKENWWAAELAKTNPLFEAIPEEIVYKIIVDPAATTSAIKNEEIDATNRINPEDYLAMEKDENVTSRYNLYSPMTGSYYLIPINMRNPKLADKRVRLALAHLVNVDEIIDEIFFGLGERTANPMPSSAPDYNKNLKPHPFDVAKAKKLLTEAGWTDSNNNGTVDKLINGKLTELSLHFLYTAGKETSQQLALLFQDNAKKAGVDIQIEAMEGRAILERWANRDFELLSAGRLMPPFWSPEQSWRTDSDNRSGFGNAETDALIDQIMTTFDVKQRRKLYYRLQEKIYDEVPEIYLFEPRECVAVHKRFDMKPLSISPGFAPAEFKLK